MNWKNNNDKTASRNEQMMKKFIVFTLLEMKKKNRYRGSATRNVADISDDDLHSADFQRFETVFKQLFDSKSDFEFKVQNEIFGKDPQKEFEFMLDFVLHVYENSFSDDLAQERFIDHHSSDFELTADDRFLEKIIRKDTEFSVLSTILSYVMLRIDAARKMTFGDFYEFKKTIESEKNARKTHRMSEEQMSVDDDFISSEIAALLDELRDDEDPSMLGFAFE